MSRNHRARVCSLPRPGASSPPTSPDPTVRAPRSTSPSRSRPPTFDQIADRLAARQHGVLTRQQLAGAGVSKGTIDRRLESGRLKPIHRGVYLVGPVLPPFALEMAACLACGPMAVLSHRSAAAVWGFVPAGRRRTMDVIIKPGGGTRRLGITTHRPEGVEPDETTVFEGVPITTPGRTLYDIARVLRPKALERAISEAFAGGRITPDELATVGRRYAGRPGGRRLVEAIGEDGPRLTRSEAEARFIRLLSRAGLPKPRVNRVLAGYEVDFHWPEERLVVEIDGFAYHGSRRSFESDRARDADLSRAGFQVVRVTWNQLSSEPLLLAARLGALLGSRAGGWPGR